jgi:hypothetical protein
MLLRWLDWALLLVLTTVIHALGSLAFLRLDAWIRPRWERHASKVFSALALSGLIGSLIALHLVEVGVWAVYYYGRGLLPDLESCAYFSLLTYTTVGYGDVVLPVAWRLFGTSEALVGILMTAWSTALFLGVVNEFHARKMAALANPQNPQNPQAPVGPRDILRLP